MTLLYEFITFSCLTQPYSLTVNSESVQEKEKAFCVGSGMLYMYKEPSVRGRNDFLCLQVRYIED